MGLRLGLLSTADINEKLVRGARGADGVEVVAVASRDGAKAQAQAAELGVPRAIEGYEALLADDEVDCVYISLPNGMHVEWSIRALQAGKHVLCEKPLTRHAADAERAFDAAGRAGRILVEAFMWRHHPQTRRLSELVREGAVGRVTGVHARFGFHLERPGDIRLSCELEGGALMDVGCYCVNGVRLVAGEPRSVSAEQVAGGVDVALSAVLHFDDDVIGTIDCSLAAAMGHALEIYGEAGTLVLTDPWHGVQQGIDIHRPGATERIEVEPADPYAHELENLARAVAGEEAPRLGRADAVGQARAIEALYRSAEEGRAAAP